MGQYSKAIKRVITVCPLFTGDLDLDLVHRVCLVLCCAEAFALQSDTLGAILVGYCWKTGLHSKTQSAGLTRFSWMFTLPENHLFFGSQG